MREKPKLKEIQKEYVVVKVLLIKDISKGNLDLYNSQLPQYGNMNVEDERVSKLLSCIHRYHRGYEQEGYIK